MIGRPPKSTLFPYTTLSQSNNLLTVITSYSDLLLQDLGGEDPKREDVEQVRKAAEGAAALTRQLLAFSRQQVLAPRVVSLSVRSEEHTSELQSRSDIVCRLL